MGRPWTEITENSGDVSPMKAPAARLETRIELPQGLVGLPEYRHFMLVGGTHEGFYWLQSLDEPGLGFVLLDPFRRFPGYSVDVAGADQGDLGPFERDELLILTLVTLGDGETIETTTNLRGPIIFNLRTRRAKQLVMSEAHLEHRASFDPVPLISAAV